MKKLVLGILAHVDAGKTTLAESLLYLGGQIRNLGRVDHGDAFLDNFSLERERGITIFSKQAQVQWHDMTITLLDTPGHVDFSAEMERTLQVLDYAVLVVNGADGVQGHTRTLWRLLERYEIPTFIFVNKLDQAGVDGNRVFESLKKQLNENCTAFSTMVYESSDNKEKPCIALREPDLLWEDIATCDEHLMNEYLENGRLERNDIAEAIAQRRLFPCYFGAALKVEGVEALLDGIEQYAPEPVYPDEFAARVYKISRDNNGARLTHLKVTGGSLRVKMTVDNRTGASEGEELKEKIDQIRIYNGSTFESADELPAGGICAVTGLTNTFAGQGLGAETENGLPLLEPVLTYRIELPEGEDVINMLGKLRRLEEEEPLLHILWQEESKEIHAQVMGEVQIEILKRIIKERFGIDVEFSAGSIVYKESIASPVVGIGHFEPLRHYAEVQLLLQPGERGSGLQFASVCSEDMLDRNWQRLILTHLEEKIHVGVLTGSPITDMRIILTAGKSHVKHTEGGDFRQATYRALRQGLRCGESILLEPVFAFVLELPSEYLGRAMSDVQRMYGTFDAPVTDGERSVLTGRAPVAQMRDYQREVNAYTHGEGQLSCVLDGYEPCHNTDEVIADKNYDPDADIQNPTGSVFCAHGAGFIVDWNNVAEYAHLEISAGVRQIVEEYDKETEGLGDNQKDAAGKHRAASDGYITQEEIEAIFRQTYGGRERDDKRRRRYHISRKNAVSGSGDTSRGGKQSLRAKTENKEDCLLVDGYNIIFAWEELRNLAKINIDSARDKLIDIMCNYQGAVGGILIVVFDAYKVKGNIGSSMKHHNIYVVYTREKETADQYIEKTVHEMADKFNITVATSDALEQIIIWGAGALRMSASGLYEDIRRVSGILRDEYGVD